SPLSDRESRQFFKSLRVSHRASTACLLRALYGCQNPLVRRLDEYENHGIIPEVYHSLCAFVCLLLRPICSALPETPAFPDFCTFSFYRCTRKRYFIKV
ncbi:Acrosin-binding protein, partial [Buceros rhinoceros silvestris]